MKPYKIVAVIAVFCTVIGFGFGYFAPHQRYTIKVNERVGKSITVSSLNGTEEAWRCYQ